MVATVKLFCLPYAGGSAAIYHQWKKYLDSNIQLCPLELAGRGKRFLEPHYDSIFNAVDDIYEQISDNLDDGPYAFFGHSMGALLSYELARKFCTSSHVKPVHLIVSGKNPPHISEAPKMYHALPENEFINKILRMGGTPPEVFQHQELLNLIIPLLRSDFRIFETYEFSEDQCELNCGITVFYGAADEEISAEKMAEWRKYTRSDYQIRCFDGGHFYINEHMEAVVGMINTILGQAKGDVGRRG